MELYITAADLKKGETALIKHIWADDMTAARLRDLGFSEQSELKCAGSGIFGDPSAYLVKGAVVALRNADARSIICERGRKTDESESDAEIPQ